MRRARVVAGVAASIGWIYSWYLFRGVRNQYSRVDIGTMPLWLLVLMGLTSTALIATAVMAMLRSDLWRPLSIAAGLLLVSSIVMAPFAVLNSYGTSTNGVHRCPNLGQSSCEAKAGLGSALAAVFATRSALSAAIFVAGIPTILVLSGLTGLVGPRIEAKAMADA